MDKKMWWIIGGIAAYMWLKKSGGNDFQGSGLGVGGAPRRGQPKSDAERRVSHYAKTGGEDLPARGTGLNQRRGF